MIRDELPRMWTHRDANGTVKTSDMLDQTPESVTVRRWVLEIGRLRSRAAKATRRIAPAASDAPDVVADCLALCETLVQELATLGLRCDELAREAHALRADWNELFEQMPVACLEVDASGIILRANTAAGGLLNTSARNLGGRILLHFAEDRETFSAILQAASFEESTRSSRVAIRPRERAPVEVDAIVVPRTPQNPVTRLWFLTTSPVPVKANRSRKTAQAEAV